MKINWRRIATTLGFVSCLAMVAPACVIRAGGAVRVRPVYVVDETPPRPRYERVTARPGYVWVQGRYEYRGSRWVWQPGYWVRGRAGYHWEHGQWVRRGNRWHWVEGRWVAAGGVHAGRPAPTSVHEVPAPPPRRVEPAPVHTVPAPPPRREVRDHRAQPPLDYPTAPPPAPRAEQPGVRAGFVWIAGHYEWRAGNWVWVNGHWERPRAGHSWRAGQWVLKGDRYIWVQGTWVKGGVEVRDHRNR